MIHTEMSLSHINGEWEEGLYTVEKKMHRRVRAHARRAHARIQQSIEQLEPRTLLAANVAPTATLSAGQQTKWNTSYTFKVVYRDANGIDLKTLDSKDISISGPNKFSAKARLISVTPTDGTNTVVTGRYKVPTPGALWDASDNGTYTVRLNAKQIADTTGKLALAKTIGTFTANVPEWPSDTGAAPDVPPGALDVRSFGAIANDGNDDTAAIQAAIDSLPRGNGVPSADSPVGGIVFIPSGNWTLSRSLRISSGVVIEGQGGTTILNNSSSDSSSGAIELVSYAGNGFVVDAAVRDLQLITARAKGVSTPGISGDIIGLQLSGLTISAGASGIDLRGEDVYQSTLRDLTINDPGSTAIWIEIGNAGGNTAINRLENVVVDGTARAGFKAERAMVVLMGDFTVNGLRIAETGAVVSALYAGVSGSMRNVSLETAASSLPGGVLATFDSAGSMSIDSLTNISGARSLKLKNAWDVQIDSMSLAGGATLADSTNVDASSHLSVNALSGAIGSVRGDRVRVGGSVIPAPTPSNAARGGASTSTDVGPVSTRVVDVSAFGARANDGIDDTAAIQAAIDSLPLGNGVPGSDSSNPVGGFVSLPRGVFNTSAPLRIPSGVWIHGQGDGTVIRNNSSDASSAALLFVPGTDAGNNIGAGVTDLAVKTTAAAGLRSDASISNSLVDLHLTNLTISAAGAGIDLRATKTYHATIRDIGIANAGSTAMWIGDANGYSSDNTTIGVQVYGSTPANFRAEKALFVFQGQNQIENLWIEQATADVLPLYVSGTADIRGIWNEYPGEHALNHVVAKFENANVTVDRLYLIDSQRRLQLSNSNASVGLLDISGRQDSLSDTLVLDAASKLNVNTVSAARDSGMLDDPRVNVAGTFSQLNRTYVNTADVLNKANLLADMSTWSIQWGDALGAITGTQTIENTATGPRLRVDVTSNRNGRPLAIVLNVNSAGNAGKSTALSYRVDGAGSALVYTTGFGQQYSSRAMNSTTAIASPTTLRGSGDQIVVVLPPLTGTFYLSNFSLVTTS